MNRTEADNLAILFGQLFPNATPQQGRTLRDALMDPAGEKDAAISTATPGDVEAAMRAELLRSPFAGDAIVGMFATLRANFAAKRRTPVDATRDMQEGWKRQAAATSAAWTAIDEDLADVNVDELLALRACVVGAVKASATPDMAQLIAKSDPARHGLARGQIHRAKGELWDFAARVEEMETA